MCLTFSKWQQILVLKFLSYKNCYIVKEIKVKHQRRAAYCISLVIRLRFFPKQSPKPRSILKDGSRSLGLFRKGKMYHSKIS